MKFFEPTMCPEPAIRSDFTRNPFVHEPILIFTTVTEEKWNTHNDPSVLLTDSVLGSMASRNSRLSKKLTKAMCARLKTQLLVWHMNELSLEIIDFVYNRKASSNPIPSPPLKQSGITRSFSRCGLTALITDSRTTPPNPVSSLPTATLTGNVKSTSMI